MTMLTREEKLVEEVVKRDRIIKQLRQENNSLRRKGGHHQSLELNQSAFVATEISKPGMSDRVRIPIFGSFFPNVYKVAINIATGSILALTTLLPVISP